jgi:hypothetical protein
MLSHLGLFFPTLKHPSLIPEMVTRGAMPHHVRNSRESNVPFGRNKQLMSLWNSAQGQASEQPPSRSTWGCCSGLLLHLRTLTPNSTHCYPATYGCSSRVVLSLGVHGSCPSMLLMHESEVVRTALTFKFWSSPASQHPGSFPHEVQHQTVTRERLDFQPSEDIVLGLQFRG